ncbi:hypothetical protein BHE74_00045252 [Ensete ventricosum]|nr:hypothetical protein BHE74_00045252 [Ensete ventricosum]
MAAAGRNGAVEVGGGGGDLKATFRQIYDRLKSQLLQDDAFDYTDEARQWIDRVLPHPAPSAIFTIVSCNTKLPIIPFIFRFAVPVHTGVPRFGQYGTIGTDIEDFKCSWLVVQALERANENQMKTLLNVFAEYERTSYEQLISAIEAQPSKAVQGVLKSFLHKIYKREK